VERVDRRGGGGDERREFRSPRLKWTKAFSSLRGSSPPPSIFDSAIKAAPSILTILTASVGAFISPLDTRNIAQGIFWPIRGALWPNLP
jgi:hypothetical protein